MSIWPFNWDLIVGRTITITNKVDIANGVLFDWSAVQFQNARWFHWLKVSIYVITLIFITVKRTLLLLGTVKPQKLQNKVKYMMTIAHFTGALPSWFSRQLGSWEMYHDRKSILLRFGFRFKKLRHFAAAERPFLIARKARTDARFISHILPVFGEIGSDWSNCRDTHVSFMQYKCSIEF